MSSLRRYILIDFPVFYIPDLPQDVQTARPEEHVALKPYDLAVNESPSQNNLFGIVFYYIWHTLFTLGLCSMNHICMHIFAQSVFTIINELHRIINKNNLQSHVALYQIVSLYKSICVLHKMLKFTEDSKVVGLFIIIDTKCSQ